MFFLRISCLVFFVLVDISTWSVDRVLIHLCFFGQGGGFFVAVSLTLSSEFELVLILHPTGGYTCRLDIGVDFGSGFASGPSPNLNPFSSQPALMIGGVLGWNESNWGGGRGGCNGV